MNRISYTSTFDYGGDIFVGHEVPLRGFRGVDKLSLDTRYNVRELENVRLVTPNPSRGFKKGRNEQN